MEILFTVFAGLAVLLIFLHVQFPYFVHDCRYILMVRSVSSKRLKIREKNYTILDCFLDRVKSQPDKPYIVFEGKMYSFLEADRQSNKVARALKTQGCLSEGDTVALFLGNEPLFVWIFLGVFKIGCTAALLNSNIRSKSFLHCLSCCKPNVLIAAAEFKEAVEEVLPMLREQNVSVFILSKDCDTLGMESLIDKIEQASDEPLSPDLRANVTIESPAFYIYTSGTTGFPKAAVVTHHKVWGATFLPTYGGITSKDVIYITLPLYHSAGLMLGLTGAIERGITIILRRKFSASQFWEDCRKHNVTVILYIGELLRYLCNTPKTDNDRNHKVKLAIGNGLRADVWREFLNRFGNIAITELYGATEGNMSFHNYVGKIGAVGRVNFYHRKVFPFGLIKYDTERDEPVRDSRGFCVAVPNGETGLFISKITSLAPFTGYMNNPQQSEKKLLRDVFQKGDLYFNSGDLLRIDQDNFIYFQDRLGDTFRWKGENVATTEVSDILTMLDFIKEANVYGVQVPGHEGRIGMATVTLKEGKQFDGTNMYSHVANYLPPYAWPRFIRIQNSLAVTGTFKQIKVKLIAEGFNPSEIQDPLYFLDDKQKSCIPLTQEIYNSVVSGNKKL